VIGLALHPRSNLKNGAKKSKISRPTFSKFGQNGCRVQIKTSKSKISLEQFGPFHSYSDAQEYLATQALYELNLNLPFHKIFPPVFQKLWKSWLNQVETEKYAQEQQDRSAKMQKIQHLIDLIPKQLRIGTADISNEEYSMTENKTEVITNEDTKREIRSATALATRKKKQYSGSQLALELKADFLRRCDTAEYKEMEETRKQLPMYKYRDEFLNCISENIVTVLCAETGAGKSTQGPQFLLEDALSKKLGDKVSIICTQPRRLSAISLADRVSDEMCVKLGGLVGYQIRGEVVKSRRTKLLFCTTGVILRRLQDDPTLTGLTTIVVDEVHERSWQIDFLLIALRKLINSGRPDLKIILMSATLDAKLFSSFFQGAPLINVPGRTFPVSHYFLEDLLDATNHIIEDDSIYAHRNVNQTNTNSLWVTTQGGEKRREVVELESMTDVSEVSGLYSSYKMPTQRSMDRVDEKVLNYDLIEDILSMLSCSDNDIVVFPSGGNATYGAILVFLPGMGEIRNLSNRLIGNRLFGDRNKFTIIPLHSSLSSRDQRRAFEKVRPGCRKIILATNIAETSVTVPDVVCVIDAGTVREVQQDKRYATSRLVLDWCSKASIKQRAGRAGRVREGICCRLFSSRTEELFMKDQSKPELQRVPLEEVCLAILAGNLSRNCTEFLMQAPQPPPLDSINMAVKLLKEVGAINIFDGQESLTAMGKHIAKLPVHVRLAKMLILGSIFKCLDPILTIVSALTCKTPFVTNTVDSSAKTTAAHKKFRHKFSDFLSYTTLWEAFQKNIKVSNDHGRSFCRKNYINWMVMMEIWDLRRQNLELLYQIGFIDKISEKEVSESAFNQNGPNDAVVHSVICAGLFPNVAWAEQENVSGSIALWHNKERLFFHPSSVNYGKKSLPSEWMIFHEKFATGRTTVSATSPILPAGILLFGGEAVIKHVDRKVIINDWIEMEMAAQTAVSCRDLRRKLDDMLLSLYVDTDTRVCEEVVSQVVQLVSQKWIY